VSRNSQEFFAKIPGGIDVLGKQREEQGERKDFGTIRNPESGINAELA
jgi:hypothetical protein